MKIVEINILDNKKTVLTGYIQTPSEEMAADAVKPAILILPGGGYQFTSDREAEPVALAYAAQGFQTFVLRYSVGKQAADKKPLREASEAIRIVRQSADEWFVNPDQIAVCGFSAGGHLAAWVGLCGEHRPNAMILCYAVTEIAHFADTRSNRALQSLIGGENYIPKELQAFSLAQYVSDASVPLFVWATSMDSIVSPLNALVLASEYAKRKLPFELHIFQWGEHGLSLAKPFTANSRPDMVDERAAGWQSLSTQWLNGIFDLSAVHNK